MRRALTLTSFVALSFTLALALAACSTSSEPGWTFSPETPAPPASADPGTSPDPGGSPAAPSPAAPSPAAPTEVPGGSEAPAGDAILLTAQNIQWVQKELTAPADAEFVIRLENLDQGTPHNVEIKQNGQSLYMGEIFNGVETRDFTIPALAAGTYEYICTVHPNMVGTLTVGG